MAAGKATRYIYLGKPLNFSACNPAFNQQASSEVKIFACGAKSGSSFSDPAGTINDVLVLFTKGTLEPHERQNDFEKSLVGCS